MIVITTAALKVFTHTTAGSTPQIGKKMSIKVQSNLRKICWTQSETFCRVPILKARSYRLSDVIIEGAFVVYPPMHTGPYPTRRGLSAPLSLRSYPDHPRLITCFAKLQLLWEICNIRDREPPPHKTARITPPWTFR